MLKLKSWVGVVASSIYLSLVSIGTAFAQQGGGEGTGGDYWGSASQFQTKFKQIWNAAVLLAGIAFVVMFLVGGLQYLTAAGNPDSAEKAKKLLVNAVIGIIIVVIAAVAGQWILGKIGGTISLQ